MLRRVNSALLMAALALLLTPTWAAAPQKKPIERYTVSGTVTGLAASHHALIKANKVCGKEVHTTSTRSDGGYTLRGVTPGSYTVRPSHARYHFHPNFISVVVRDSSKEGIDFKAELTAQPKKR